MTIGEKIKTLRRKHDLTQEKLAEYLAVSSQAVSKWECGLACPDLSLIGPLTKLLHCTADELLGLTREEEDVRKAYFDREYHQYWMKADHKADLEIAQQAVAEYPGEYRYLEWLAGVEFYVGYSVEYAGTEKETELLNRSIGHYRMILEDCGDPVLRNQAISGIVWDYKCLGQYDEAKKYAMMYPEAPETTRDELLARCLNGEELADLRRKIAYRKFKDFCMALHYMWEFSDMREDAAMDAEEAVIRTVIDDGNYLGFHWNLYFISMERAEIAAAESRYDDAVKHLADAREYALGFDGMYAAGISHHTCTLFRGCAEDTRDSRNETGTYLDWFRETLKEKEKFAPLRTREDFRCLIGETEGKSE